MRDRPSDEHRRRTERELGRKLGRNEIVHHKNELKDDNTPQNREIISRSAHTVLHNKARALSRLRKTLAMGRHKEKLY